MIAVASCPIIYLVQQASLARAIKTNVDATLQAMKDSPSNDSAVDGIVCKVLHMHA